MGSCLDFSGLWCLTGQERQSALLPVHPGHLGLGLRAWATLGIHRHYSLHGFWSGGRGQCRSQGGEGG